MMEIKTIYGGQVLCLDAQFKQLAELCRFSIAESVTMDLIPEGCSGSYIVRDYLH